MEAPRDGALWVVPNHLGCLCVQLPGAEADPGFSICLFILRGGLGEPDLGVWMVTFVKHFQNSSTEPPFKN